MKDFDMEQINSQIDFFKEMRLHGLQVPEDKVIIEIQNSKTVLSNAFKFFLKQSNTEFIWRDEYNQIVEWMENNNGRGLFLFGDCGLGKSLLSRYVLPAILLYYQHKVMKSFTAQQMNEKIDDILNFKLISLDDIGTEDVINKYGNKRLAFAEIMDAVERESKLVVISTNLQGEEIESRYGTRTMERIISTTKRIKFTGKSLRK